MSEHCVRIDTDRAEAVAESGGFRARYYCTIIGIESHVWI